MMSDGSAERNVKTRFNTFVCYMGQDFRKMGYLFRVPENWNEKLGIYIFWNISKWWWLSWSKLDHLSQEMSSRIAEGYSDSTPLYIILGALKIFQHFWKCMCWCQWATHQVSSLLDHHFQILTDKMVNRFVSSLMLL